MKIKAAKPMVYFYRILQLEKNRQIPKPTELSLKTSESRDSKTKSLASWDIVGFGICGIFQDFMRKVGPGEGGGWHIQTHTHTHAHIYIYM